MYQDFFGLKSLPFKITSDLKFFYKHASREDIVNALCYSVVRGDGIIKVVGEVGAGKTTMLRLLSEKIPKNYIKVYISSPNLSPIDFLKYICSELNVPLAERATKLDVINSLQYTLISYFKQQKKVVLLVDEAQSMMVDTLEEVRLLGNLETQTDKLIQIVLFGQPELDITLSDDRLKPLKDRLANEFYVPLFSNEEVQKYLNYRMRVAGSMYENVFDKTVSTEIQRITKGLPRAINLLGDKLLMSAFSEGDDQVSLKHLRLLGYSTIGFFSNKPWLKWWLAVMAGLAIIGCIFWLLKSAF